MPRKPNKSATKRRLDIAFSQAMRDRVTACEVCGKGPDQVQLHAHHAVVGRANHRCRFEPRNMAILCAAHHRWAHNYPLAWADWMRTHRKDDVEYIESIQNEITRYSVHDYLEMLATYTAGRKAA